MKIKTFFINSTDKTLTIEYTNDDTALLNFEYLRISTPMAQSSKGKNLLPSHKKNVQLNAIEIVGKHGYRLLFDDQHSAIYTEEYLQQLITEYDSRWDKYLLELKESGHSREDMINITQL